MNIATLRKERGLSQAALAEKLGVTQASIANYESGRREPSITMLRKIAAALGVDIATLIG
jgi:transcriptional regulator with XRE-family HTH domain